MLLWVNAHSTLPLFTILLPLWCVRFSNAYLCSWLLPGAADAFLAVCWVSLARCPTGPSNLTFLSHIVLPFILMLAKDSTTLLPPHQESQSVQLSHKHTHTRTHARTHARTPSCPTGKCPVLLNLESILFLSLFLTAVASGFTNSMQQLVTASINSLQGFTYQ